MRSDCDRTCHAREGRWCDECWRVILRGGFWYEASPNEEEPTDDD